MVQIEAQTTTQIQMWHMWPTRLCVRARGK